jgi:signal transduction histidine kinase
MAVTESAGYTLRVEDETAEPEHEEREQTAAFDLPLLANNVRWFCRLRWIVILVLSVYGSIDFSPGLTRILVFRSPGAWPFLVSLFLLGANLVYLVHAKLCIVRTESILHARMNLWSQIVIDLSVLTLVIYHIGALETYAPFMYLFHTTLVCLFFSRAQSFIVVGLASGLYASLVFVEVNQLTHSTGIYSNRDLKEAILLSPEGYYVNILLFLGIICVVWYLTSGLSERVRKRDRELMKLNKRLVKAQEEKDRYMLRTTHELKAPFAAIEASVQLLRKGYCGELSDDAMAVLGRIDRRCKRLGNEILEMLQLANLRSIDMRDLPWQEIDLAEELEWSMNQIRYIAEERRVTIEAKLTSIRLPGLKEQLRILFANLLSNAILYSNEGGVVGVQCERDTRGMPRITIRDDGIGIAPEKISKIFDEYYRTDEAVKHNKSSSGLGLAIVKRIALLHNITVAVESKLNAGTAFTLRFGNAG